MQSAPRRISGFIAALFLLLGAAIPTPAGTEISTANPPPFGAVGLGGLEFEISPDGQTVVYLGTDGDDDLRGGNDDDILNGGPDVDEADGGGGTDTCIAETVIDCEA